jgi:hypothetical protein
MQILRRPTQVMLFYPGRAQTRPSEKRQRWEDMKKGGLAKRQLRPGFFASP